MGYFSIVFYLNSTHKNAVPMALSCIFKCSNRASILLLCHNRQKLKSSRTMLRHKWPLGGHLEITSPTLGHPTGTCAQAHTCANTHTHTHTEKHQVSHESSMWLTKFINNPSVHYKRLIKKIYSHLAYLATSTKLEEKLCLLIQKAL
jgi:hypothetical protein